MKGIAKKSRFETKAKKFIQNKIKKKSLSSNKAMKNNKT
jgi:hypothetical protein